MPGLSNYGRETHYHIHGNNYGGIKNIPIAISMNKIQGYLILTTVVAFISLLLYITIDKNKTLSEKYFTPYTSETAFEQQQLISFYYDNEQFYDVIIESEKCTNIFTPEESLLLACAFIQTQRYYEARIVLDKIINSGEYLSNAAIWYKGITLIADKHYDEAVKCFLETKNDREFKNKSKKMLKELKKFSDYYH